MSGPPFGRVTRSGRVFSPFIQAKDVVPVYTDVDFSILLSDAIERELDASLDGDDCDEVDDIHVVPIALTPHGNRKRPSPSADEPTADTPRSTNSHRHQKRKEARDASIALQGHQLGAKAKTKLTNKVEPVTVDYTAADFPAAKNAYTARRAAIPHAQKEYTPAELDALGLRCIPYQPGKIRPIVDRCRRVVGCFTDKPDDPSWDVSCHEILKSMTAEYEGANFKQKVHTRGRHPAINVGPLMGQGQKLPMTARLGTCTTLVERLVGDENVKRMATFASAAFGVWAPRIHEHFRTNFDLMLKELPEVQRNFPKSVFPATCLNLGGNVVNFKHRDILNVPFGWCPVTPFGVYDYRKGAHIILWDFNVYFEFPHGCTIFLPSASCVHSNTPLADPLTECRSSFTQYFPGAILRWIDNGFMTDKELKAKDIDAFKDLEKVKAGRWAKGLDMFSTIDEIMESLSS